MNCLKWIWDFRRYLIFVLTPILFSPIPIVVQTQEAYTAYVIIWVALYWCTEVVALPVTGLLPAVLLPLFGVLKAQNVANQYTKDVSLLVLASLTVSIAIEESNLHKRVALKMLMWAGSSAKLLMLGLMLTTGILSMWISNTAATAMMTQIIYALLEQLAIENQDAELNSISPTDENATTVANSIQSQEIANNISIKKDQLSYKSRSLQKLNKAFLLCIPCAANIGGSGTLTGSVVNLVGANVVDSYFGSESGINFGTWMAYSVPGMFACLFLSWMWLSLYYMGCSSTQAIIKKQYRSLGPMSFAEKVVLGHFLMMIGLWLTRDLRVVPGWAVLFEDGYVSDSTSVLIVAISLFAFPRTTPIFPNQGYDGTNVWNPILTWKLVKKKMPWGIYIYIGAGFAIAEGCKVSGLSSWLGTQLIVLQYVNPILVVLLSSVVVAAVTEFTSNISTASIFLPLLAELAVSIRMNPLYIVLPSTIACSYAFMLPVATPPNAVAFAYGSLKVLDMVKSGAILNIICILVTNISINTIGVIMFDVRNFPDWALTPANFTEMHNTTVI